MPNASNRIKNRLNQLPDREPVWRRLENKLQDIPHNIRDKPDNRIEETFPEFENRNFGQGKAVGAVLAGIADVLEDVIGVPFGASSDIVDSQPVENGVVYTVNVNAPMESMAEARAMIDSTTGYTSYFTDQFSIEKVEIQKTRVLRDTFQVEVLVED